jgi:toxin-antitoxin system PIN domain toxin
VILIDVNILVYATNSATSQHASAHEWLNRKLAETDRVGLPWASLLGFLRLATGTRIFPRALTMADAWTQVSRWLECEPVWIPQPTERHAETLGKLIAEPGVHSNLVPDAHLAALAIEHGLTLCSTDGDFARFPGLKWSNPLARLGPG